MQPDASATSFLPTLIMMGIIFGIFYLLIIRPAQKKQKTHQNLVDSLKGGEKIITAGGIYGTVGRVIDDRVEVQVDKNTKIMVSKGSVSAVIQPEKDTKDSK